MKPGSIAGYSAPQIVLHWLIAALVLFQLVFGESMGVALDAAEEGTPVPAGDASLALAHYWIGLAILVLVGFRLALRLTAGAPSPQPSGTPIFDRLAHVVHWLFYALLVAMPVTGLLAYYVSPEIGEVHEIGKPLFILLIAVHVAGALYHQFLLKDGTLRRMLVPGG